jgi:hypothetical protein
MSDLRERSVPDRDFTPPATCTTHTRLNRGNLVIGRYEARPLSVIREKKETVLNVLATSGQR